MNPAILERARAAGLGVETDVEVARRLGVSRERVRQIRNTQGLPVARVIGADGKRHLPRTVRADEARLKELRKLRPRSLREASAALGVPASTLGHTEKRTGRATHPHGRSVPGALAHGPLTVTLKQAREACLRSSTVADAARRVGMSPGNFHAWMHRFGVWNELRALVFGERLPRPRTATLSNTPQQVLRAVRTTETLTEAARLLGCHPSNLRVKIARLGLREQVDALMLARELARVGRPVSRRAGKDR